MKFKIIYVDDVEKDRDFFTFQFGEYCRDKFSISTFKPPKTREEYESKVKSQKADLFLIDLDLSIPEKRSKERSIFDGLSLAMELSNKNPSVPIILFTREEIIKRRKPSKQALAIIDETVYKGKLFVDDTKNLDILYNFVQGFKLLRDCKVKNIKSLLSLLNDPNPEIDTDDLRISSPLFNSYSWEVSDVASWIRGVLLKYPGILLDSIFCATLLGITKDEFLNEDIQNLFRDARYTGIFTNGFFEKSKDTERWWKSKIIDMAIDIAIEQGKTPTSLKKSFPISLEQKMDRKIQRSKCNSSSNFPADSVCFIEKEPVSYEYSLAYYPDSRPSVMEEARVSYKAIQETDKINLNLIDATDRELIPKIRKMKE